MTETEQSHTEVASNNLTQEEQFKLDYVDLFFDVCMDLEVNSLEVYSELDYLKLYQLFKEHGYSKSDDSHIVKILDCDISAMNFDLLRAVVQQIISAEDVTKCDYAYWFGFYSAKINTAACDDMKALIRGEKDNEHNGGFYEVRRFPVF